jgi:hypothetical protein
MLNDTLSRISLNRESDQNVNNMIKSEVFDHFIENEFVKNNIKIQYKKLLKLDFQRSNFTYGF